MIPIPQVIVDFCLMPLGPELSLYRRMPAQGLQDAGLTHQLHACGTNIEGDWDQVMAAVKRCHARVHEMGVPRINTTLKIGAQVDLEQSIADKVSSVEALTRN